MRSKNLQEAESYKRDQRDFINQDLLEAYNRLVAGNKLATNDKDIKQIIKGHAKTINRTNLVGKGKYKTLILLEHYKNTQNKETALAILTGALNNKGLFDYFLSDVEKKEKRWAAKGRGQKF